MPPRYHLCYLVRRVYLGLMTAYRPAHTPNTTTFFRWHHHIDHRRRPTTIDSRTQQILDLVAASRYAAQCADAGIHWLYTRRRHLLTHLALDHPRPRLHLALDHP